MILTVYGTPIPQGSTKAFVPKGWKRAIITADNAKTKPWRQAIVDASREQMAGKAPHDGPLALRVVFYLPRPKTAPRRVLEPAKKPDTDKLLRAVMDALTASGVWVDDAQVVQVEARKVFAGGALDELGAAGIPRATIAVSTPQSGDARVKRLEWVVRKMLSEPTWLPAPDILDPKRDVAWQQLGLLEAAS